MTIFSKVFDNHVVRGRAGSRAHYFSSSDMEYAQCTCQCVSMNVPVHEVMILVVVVGDVLNVSNAH